MSDFRVRSLKKLDEKEKIADDLRVLGHPRYEDDNGDINSFIPLLDLPLSIATSEIDKPVSQIRNEMSKTYGVYESQLKRDYPQSYDYSLEGIDDIVDKYLGKERFKSGNIPKVLSKCYSCNSVVSQPVDLLYDSPDQFPVLLKKQPYAFESRAKARFIYTLIPDELLLNKDDAIAKIKRYYLNSDSEIMPIYNPDEYTKDPTDMDSVNEVKDSIEEDIKEDEEDIETASDKFDDSMAKLGDKLKMFE